MEKYIQWVCGANVPGSRAYILYLYNLYLYIEIEFCVYKERYCYKYNTLLVPSFTVSSVAPSLQTVYKFTLQGLHWICTRSFLPTGSSRTHCLDGGRGGTEGSGRVSPLAGTREGADRRGTQTSQRPCQRESKHIWKEVALGCKQW